MTDKTKTTPITGEFTVGNFTCKITASLSSYDTEWSPRLPTKNEFTPEMLKQYRRARKSVIEELEKQAGGKIIVMEA